MIYADYNGSAPLSSSVKNYLIERFEKGPFANPNSIHQAGRLTHSAMEKARKICAKALGAKSKQLLLTSGATEGLSTVFHALLTRELVKEKNIILTSQMEHSAVANNIKEYSSLFSYEVLEVNSLASGIIDFDHFQEIFDKHKDKIALVSIMAANNETGVINPYLEIAKLCHQNEVKYLCDTTQLIGKAPFHFENSLIDFAVVSGHKLGAMTGTGLLLAKNLYDIHPLIIGGGQEKGLRGGTQNYLGMETLAIVFEELDSKFKKISLMAKSRENFEIEIKKRFPEVVILGEKADRLATTTLISYPGLHGQAIQIELESHDIFVTTSSACSDNEPQTSKVLKAMGVDDKVGRGVVRISLGLDDPPEIYEEILEALKRAYSKLAQIKSF